MTPERALMEALVLVRRLTVERAAARAQASSAERRLAAAQRMLEAEKKRRALIVAVANGTVAFFGPDPVLPKEADHALESAALTEQD